MSIDGVKGALIIYRDFVGVGGKVPKMLKVKS
jgi:ApbE superfamily uncharacterized protein (UPF0280 family)